MGQVLHGCATTTEAVRRALQHSQESLRTLAKRGGGHGDTTGLLAELIRQDAPSG